MKLESQQSQGLLESFNSVVHSSTHSYSLLLQLPLCVKCFVWFESI